MGGGELPGNRFSTRNPLARTVGARLAGGLPEGRENLTMERCKRTGRNEFLRPAGKSPRFLPAAEFNSATGPFNVGGAATDGSGI